MGHRTSLGNLGNSCQCNTVQFVGTPPVVKCPRFVAGPQFISSTGDFLYFFKNFKKFAKGVYRRGVAAPFGGRGGVYPFWFEFMIRSLLALCELLYNTIEQLCQRLCLTSYFVTCIVFHRRSDSHRVATSNKRV
jgi:hypothetical protein